MYRGMRNACTRWYLRRAHARTRTCARAWCAHAHAQTHVYTRHTNKCLGDSLWLQALMDSLNQMPHYLIRGEQWAAFYHLYMFHKWLTASFTERAREYQEETKRYAADAEPRQLAEAAGPDGGGSAAGLPAVEQHLQQQLQHRLSYGLVKGIYDKHAPTKKLPWFNVSRLRLDWLAARQRAPCRLVEHRHHA